jgi:predicted patatin/cPLA2 family phospholipase
LRCDSLKTLLVHCCVAAVVSGCSGVPERNPLPGSLSEQAQIPDIPRARYWADAVPPETDEWFTLTKKELRVLYPASFGQPHNYLAISGGGPNGAYAAGMLNGWTDAGDRPTFTIVTGVSAGALIAPFAFLGPDYDHVIKEVFTGYSTTDIVTPRGNLKTLLGDAATDSTPLREKLAKYVDEKVMLAIAEEYRKGRVLDIVTTNLDAGRPVVWNIGLIASSGSPDALQLIHDIMLASASIPAAFPPVMFEVEANGEYYDELHVDGGATSVLYLYPIGIDFEKLADHMDVKGTPNVYVIRNGKLQKRWKTVDRSTIPIAMRSLDSLMSSVVLGDIYRIYLSTRRDGLNYNLAFIPETFTEEASEPFDREYMTSLFNLGYEQARNGYEWSRTPPGYDTRE